ncbi:MAG: hypothetical protein AAFO79_00045 [Pseudomonadota bacterium]
MLLQRLEARISQDDLPAVFRTVEDAPAPVLLLRGPHIDPQIKPLGLLDRPLTALEDRLDQPNAIAKSTFAVVEAVLNKPAVQAEQRRDYRGRAILVASSNRRSPVRQPQRAKPSLQARPGQSKRAHSSLSPARVRQSACTLADNRPKQRA